MAARTYEDAIDALNTLQTSFRVIEERRKAGIFRVQDDPVGQMKLCLKRIGHSTHDLDRLNIVHVAGTKGKGTTCAYVDSILSYHQKARGKPRKIGLFTSPHLVSVRERIRIDSKPISADLFTKYFFEVWDALESSDQQQSDGPFEKPVYFRYLTLMSYHVFLKEAVDAAVYEVGVGGEYDATNAVDRPAVVGISTLGIDHVATLGSTIDKIAWHKAGIMKKGSLAFTVSQVPDAMATLEQRASEKEVELQVVAIDPRLAKVDLMPKADFQRRNASLAVALTSTLLRKVDATFKMPEHGLPQAFVDGLEKVVWRGRCEIKEEGNIRWYLDGAHTVDSLKVAAKWFGDESARISPGPRILIFNQQGRSEAVDLLEGFFHGLKGSKSTKFDHVIFCTNVTFAEAGYKRDFVNYGYDADAISRLTVQKAFADKWKTLDAEANVTVAASIEAAIDRVRSVANADSMTVGAFITGSLHLIGGALEVLEGSEAV